MDWCDRYKHVQTKNGHLVNTIVIMANRITSTCLDWKFRLLVFRIHSVVYGCGEDSSIGGRGRHLRVGGTTVDNLLDHEDRCIQPCAGPGYYDTAAELG